MNLLVIGLTSQDTNILKLCNDFIPVINERNIEIQPIKQIPNFIILDDTIINKDTKIVLLRDLPEIRRNLMICPSYENFKLRTLWT